MEILKDKLQLCFNTELQLYKEDNEYYIDAEELWKWLEVKTKFNDWIKRRIVQYKFEYNNDFKNYYYKIDELKFENVKNIDEFNNSQQASRNGYSLKYFLKPDMTKQLAMVEDADKGKLVREFYLNLEKYIIETNQIKEYYQWVDKRIVEAHETYEFYNLINDEGKCIALSKCLYNIVSYKCNLSFIHNKEQVFQLSLNTDNKKPWLLYQEIKENAETYVKYWMKKNSDNFMHNVIDDLLDEYIEDKKEFESYCKSYKKDTLIIERNIIGGFGILKPLIIE